MSDELKKLKEEAKEKGISFPKNAGVEAMQSLLEEHQLKADAEEMEKNTPKTKAEDKEAPSATTPLSDKVQMVKNLTRLTRIRLTPINPALKGHKSTLISTNHKYTGMISKVIPFDGKPFLVPEVLVKLLEGKRYTIYEVVGKDRFGQDIKKPRRVPAYTVERLPDVTEEELEKMRKAELLSKVEEL